MTVLVFTHPSGRTIICQDWSAIEEDGNWCQVTSATGWVGGTATIKISSAEFLALIAEGGKIVDVRHLQTIG